MRVSKLNEDRLQEIRRKKYLNELVDLCLYGECLQEETAREYFEWLKAKIHNTGNGVPDKRFNGDRDSLFRGKDVEHQSGGYSQILRGLADERFQDRKRHQQIRNGIIEHYFDGNSLSEFYDDFLQIIAQKLNNNQITKDESLKIRDCFDYYCNLFAKEIVTGNEAFTPPNPDFSLEENWEEKKSVKKGKKSLNRGESWEAA